MITRKRFLTTVLAAVPATVLGLHAADQSDAQTITAATPETPAANPKPDAHGPMAPSKKGWGPMKTETYVDVVIRPEVHGYATYEFMKPDRTFDVFKVRQRLDMGSEVTAEPAEQVRQVVASAKTLRELEPASKKTEPPTARIFYTDIKRVVNGREIDVRDFEMAVTISREDINIFDPLQRLDEVPLFPPAVMVTWREMVFMGQSIK